MWKMIIECKTLLAFKSFFIDLFSINLFCFYILHNISNIPHPSPLPPKKVRYLFWIEQPYKLPLLIAVTYLITEAKIS